MSARLVPREWARARQIRASLAALKTPAPEWVIPPTTTLSAPGELPCDVYRPSRPTGASAVLVHGGGFTMGARDMKPVRIIASHLAAQGVTVFSLSYRLLPRARLAGMVDDVRGGAAFARSQGRAWGLDAGRVSLCGLSAGGTLVLLANDRDDGAYRSVISAFALTDVDRVGGATGRVVSAALARRSRRASLSPVRTCRTQTPVTLLHGTADAIVPVWHSRALALARGALPTALHEYEGEPHAFLSHPSSDAGARALAVIAETVSD